MPFEKELLKLAKRRPNALRMGGEEKVRKQHTRGRLTARERLNMLLDEKSFFEIGMLNQSGMPGMEDKTPAQITIAGLGMHD